MSSSEDYYKSRFVQMESRKKVWQVLAGYLCRRFDLQGSFLDVGCGYGDFINNVAGSQRFAIDLYPDSARHLQKDIEFAAGDVAVIDTLVPEALMFDCIFSSNLLEHLSRDTINHLLEFAHRRLRPNGKLVFLLPNYKRAFKEYFDDYTHITPLSDEGLKDWLIAKGFEIEFVHPGFMPYSMKNSRLPVTDFLVKLWLRSPWKPGGKQMLLVARR